MGPASFFTAHLELRLMKLCWVFPRLLHGSLFIHIYRTVSSRIYQEAFTQTLQATCRSL